MTENQNDHNVNGVPAGGEAGRMPNHSESFRIVPNGSEGFGKVPNDAETFRTFPNGSEGFRTLPHQAERSENHTLTVKETARMFEEAGVARTERSIVNWCQSTRTGMARLDGYYDPNERRYYITPQSVSTAIAEEKAKAEKANRPAEPFRTVPNDTETFRSISHEGKQARTTRPNEPEVDDLKELENEIRDLQITNKAKDMIIEKMEKERSGFFEQVINAHHKMGELEAKLMQLEGPKN